MTKRKLSLIQRKKELRNLIRNVPVMAGGKAWMNRIYEELEELRMEEAKVK